MPDDATGVALKLLTSDINIDLVQCYNNQRHHPLNEVFSLPACHLANGYHLVSWVIKISF